jgi:hypothetical protein
VSYLISKTTGVSCSTEVDVTVDAPVDCPTIIYEMITILAKTYIKRDFKGDN